MHIIQLSNCHLPPWATVTSKLRSLSLQLDSQVERVPPQIERDPDSGIILALEVAPVLVQNGPEVVSSNSFACQSNILVSVTRNWPVQE